MTSGQRNDSEFVFPDRVFGQMKEHRRSLGTWGDLPSANHFDTPPARRSSFGSLGGVTPTGTTTLGYAPPSYGTYYEDFGGYPNTSSKMNSQSMQPIRYPSPNSFGYQRSFMNAYFKPASASAEDGVYRCTPPPPALVDDRLRVTPTSGGYFDSEVPLGEMRYGSGSNVNRSTPPPPMPYASFGGGQHNASVMSTTGSSSGYSTPTGELESMMGDNVSTTSVPIRPIAMPTVVTRENPTNTKMPQQQTPPVVVQDGAATTAQPFNLASEGVTVLPPTIIQDNPAPPMMAPVAPMIAPIVMPPSVIAPAIAPIVNTPTVAVSVSEPILLATPVPEMVFIPPPPPGAAAALGPRTVLDILPRETKPPTVVREMGPALPPVLGVDVSFASSSAMMTPPNAGSRASTPTPSPKNSMGRTSTPSPMGAQIPVATPPECMWNVTQMGVGGRGTPSPTPSNAMAQVPVATPPGMMAPMGPPPNAVPVGTTDAIVTDDDSEKKAHGIHRLTQKMHRHKK